MEPRLKYVVTENQKIATKEQFIEKSEILIFCWGTFFFFFLTEYKIREQDKSFNSVYQCQKRKQQQGILILQVSKTEIWVLG